MLFRKLLLNPDNIIFLLLTNQNDKPKGVELVIQSKNAKTERKWDAFHQRCLRRVQRMHRQNYITKEDILKKANTRPLSKIIIERKLKLVGHIQWVP